MSSKPGKYILHCQIPVEVGAKLDEVSRKTGFSKVGIVKQALLSFFNAFDLQQEMLNKLANDPVKAAEMAKVLDLDKR